MSGEEWSDAENDAIVADYFSMLADELAGRAYNKAAHNRALQDLIGRSKGSIEYKHQNVSAVLKGLGETWIEGYKPAFNFQMSLVDSIEKRLQQTDDWFPKSRASLRSASDQDGTIGMGPSPNLQNYPPPDEREQMEALARRFDVATRDAANRALGKAGERCVLQFERATLSSAGRADLAEQVRWVSQEEGDGAGYDILSFAPDGRRRLVEVKTTNGWERTPFHISQNELMVADANKDNWVLFRVWNFVRRPLGFELFPPLAAQVRLTPTSYHASFLHG